MKSYLIENLFTLIWYLWWKSRTSWLFRHALPESPPDSGSEPPYSPPGHNDTQHVHSPRKSKLYKSYFNERVELCNLQLYIIADQKAALQEILLHHQSNQYPSNLLPPSPRALPATTTDPLLLTPVLTPHLTSGTTNISTQPQIGPSLVQLSHESHNPPSINTLYSSLQSAPKKRKLSQDGLIHVKQVNSFVRKFMWSLCFSFVRSNILTLFFRNLNWVLWNTAVAAAVRYSMVTKSPTAITSTPVISAFGSTLSNKHPGTFFVITISKSYQCRITGWTPTKVLILAIRMTHSSVRKRIISR